MIFTQNWKEFVSSKTNWVGITSIVGAIAGYLTNEMSLTVALAALMFGLQTLFVRDAIAKKAV